MVKRIIDLILYFDYELNYSVFTMLKVHINIR